MALTGTRTGLTEFNSAYLGNLLDVSVSGASNGQSLVYQNGVWVPGTGATSARMGSFSWNGTAYDTTIYLNAYSAYAYTIVSILGIQTTSGAVTVALKINGTNVTGLSAISVTSSPQNVSASGANNLAIGDVLTLVLTSSASPVDLRFTVSGTI